MTKDFLIIHGVALFAGALSVAAYPVVARADDLSDALRSGYCWEKYHDYNKVDVGYELRGFDLARIDADVVPLDSGFLLKSRRDKHTSWKSVPCAHPDKLPPSSLWGWEIGPETSLALSFLFNVESPVPVGLPTFQSADRNSGGGGGAVAMVTIPVNIPNATVKAFASVDGMHDTVDHTFSGGSTLGTTSNVLVTGGIKAGPNIAGTWVYGIVGLAALNESLHVNFLPLRASTTTTVGGAAAGAGFAFTPSFLRGLGTPVALFAEFQHVWYQDAHFNSPASSPGFNYTFRREDNLVKLGLTFALATPAAPVVSGPGFPVKALPLK
jgi:hypothetical protein